jgi:endonuclease/exonuclease/phosphatase family metal-dependent hydrolase
MSSNIARLAGLVLACVLAAVSVARAEDTASLRLKVMTFNIWLGGDQVNFDKVIEAIRAADADIVCLQEPAGNTARIAAALGWSHALPNRHVIARFPLFAPPAATGPDGNALNYAYAEVMPGKFIAIADVHLPSGDYGPYAMRDGKSASEVLEIERNTRLPAITAYIEPSAAMAKSGLPVIIAGDFNAPSPLDWTPATLASHGFAQIKDAFAWPAAQALLDAGFTDTYRAAHPDPAAKPGITWSYGYPYPKLEANEALDRIDLIMALGAVKTVKSEILGDPAMPDTDIAVAPWPSDHRAVVSTLDVVPGPAPAMVSIARRGVTQGEMVEVRFHAATADGRIEDGRIAVRAGNAAPEAAPPLLSFTTNDGTDRMNSVSFGTYDLAVGAYSAALVDGAGKTLAEAPFWVLPEGKPSVETGKASFASGEPITVSWSHAPGNRFDWIGLYAKGEPDNMNYLGFFYIDAAPEGTLTLGKEQLGEDLKPGDYEVRLELDDAYVPLAGAGFSVK